MYLNLKQPGTLELVFQNRAVQAGGDAFTALCEEYRDTVFRDERWKITGIRIRAEDWNELADKLTPVLTAMLEGWKSGQAQLSPELTSVMVQDDDQ